MQVQGLLTLGTCAIKQACVEVIPESGSLKLHDDVVLRWHEYSSNFIKHRLRIQTNDNSLNDTVKGY